MFPCNTHILPYFKYSGRTSVCKGKGVLSSPRDGVTRVTIPEMVLGGGTGTSFPSFVPRPTHYFSKDPSSISHTTTSYKP